MHRILRINEGPIAVDDQARIILREAPFKTDAADDRSRTDLSAANNLRAGRKSGPNSRQDLGRAQDLARATQGSVRAHARQKQLPPTESGGALSFAVGDPRVAERQGGDERASPVPPRRPIALVIVSILFAMGHAGSSLHLDHAGRFRLTDDVGIAAR